MKKYLFSILISTLLFSCEKDDEFYKGYTSIEDLKEKATGDWLASLVVGDVKDFFFIEYHLAEENSYYIQLKGNFEDYGVDYDLDTMAVLDWGIEENYRGYNAAGLSGDAIRIHCEDGSTVYLLVKSISEDSLYSSTAYNNVPASINFYRDRDMTAYYSKVASTAKNFKSALTKSATQTKGGASLTASNGSGWMSGVPNNLKLNYMSIPGTHDACTFNVQEALAFAAQSQEKSLYGQWDCGVRAFDFRMRKERETYMYHDFISCEMTFKNALTCIYNKVTENPREGAIVIVCPEGNGFVKQVGWWGRIIVRAVNLLTQFGFEMSEHALDEKETVEDAHKIIQDVVPQNKIAHYDPEMTMGDLRGKILFIVRSDEWKWYDVGAKAANWGENKEIYYKGKDGSVKKSAITVQDQYGPDDGESNGDYITRKRNAFKTMWENNCFSLVDEDFSSTTLVVNQPSGFVLDQAFPDYVSACNELYGDFIGCVSSKPRSRGIILQDYAGIDNTERICARDVEICAGVAFAIPLLPRETLLDLYLDIARACADNKDTHGQQLVDAVINNNFKAVDSKIDLAMIKRVAKEFNIDFKALLAIADAASEGHSHRAMVTDDAQKRPTIYFDGSMFWKQLRTRGYDTHKLSLDNPDIVYEKWTNAHFTFGRKEWERYQRACEINADAAKYSAYWGKYLIKGTVFNFKTIDDAIKQVYQGEEAQLRLLCNLMLGDSRISSILKQGVDSNNTSKLGMYMSSIVGGTTKPSHAEDYSRKYKEYQNL